MDQVENRPPWEVRDRLINKLFSVFTILALPVFAMSVSQVDPMRTAGVRFVDIAAKIEREKSE